MDRCLVRCAGAHVGCQRSTGAKTTTSTLNIGGGQFTADVISMAENVAKGGQKILSSINLSGSGALSVDGNVVMGTRNGVAPALTSRVDIASGVMKVHGNLEPGSDSSFIVSEVLLKGGALVVTNARRRPRCASRTARSRSRAARRSSIAS